MKPGFGWTRCQIFGDRTIFLPGKGVIEIIIPSKWTMQVPLVERRLGEARIVVGHGKRREVSTVIVLADFGIGWSSARAPPQHGQILLSTSITTSTRGR
jgi:hypothetical protein